MHRSPINVSYIVKQLDSKFTNYMEEEVDRWRMNEEDHERQVLRDVKKGLLKHAEHCRRIYNVTAVMLLISLFFFYHSTPGMLYRILNFVLLGILARQVITVEKEPMWPILFRVMRTYAPYITLPFAGLVGIIGYNMENLFSDKFTPYQKSISQQRKDRQEAEAGNDQDGLSSLKERKFVARTVFEKNLSPSLQN